MSMENKNCLITGATSGIGRIVARELAGRGAQVIVVGRNKEKSERTVKEIREETGNTTVEYMLADLSLLKEVRTLADQVKSQYDSLDVLVNNAGAIFTTRDETGEGLERTFALNHLSYFLLTNLLLDLIIDSAPARIINVASNAHRGEQLDFDDLQHRKSYSPQKVYGESKLANILFTYELARRLEEEDVTVNAVHPGFVNSGFGKNNGKLMKAVMSFLHLFARSPDEGAKTVIYLATSPEVEETTGEYFFDDETVESSPASYDRETALNLWEASMHLTGLETTV